MNWNWQYTCGVRSNEGKAFVSLAYEYIFTRNRIRSTHTILAQYQVKAPTMLPAWECEHCKTSYARTEDQYISIFSTSIDLFIFVLIAVSRILVLVMTGNAEAFIYYTKRILPLGWDQTTKTWRLNVLPIQILTTALRLQCTPYRSQARVQSKEAGVWRRGDGLTLQAD